MKQIPKLLVFLCIFIFTIVLSAQQNLENTYNPIESSGKLPDELQKLSAEKFELRKNDVKKDKRRLRKTKEDFILQSTFAVDELLLSGDVLFNDPIGIYVNKVADVVLKDEPELRKKIRFYIVKSDYVNAFTTDRGAIFFSLGLIAKLRNEAELAFIISHEVIHYKKNHIINGYVETENIVKERGQYKNQDFKEKLLSRSNYSKELEIEADHDGLEIFKKTDYDLMLGKGTFEILQYNYVPFDNLFFDYNILTNQYFSFPKNYLLDQIAKIEADDDYDDSESSHPNLKRRKALYLKGIDTTNYQSKKAFIVSKEEFENVREISRFELSNIYASEGDYANAIYNSYLLLQKYPKNKFLKTNIAYSLYATAKYKNNKRFSSVVTKYSKIQGESQQVNYLLKALEDKELSAIAVHYLWNLSKEYPEDQFIKKLREGSFKLLVEDNKIGLDFYFTLADVEKIKAEKAEQENFKYDPYAKIDTNNLSRLEKLKLEREIKNRVKKREEVVNFDKFIFVDLIKDESFVANYEKATEVYEAKIAQEEDYVSYKKRRKKSKRIEKYGISLGIDTIVLADPFYGKYDERKDIQNKYIKSEKGQLDFRQYVFDAAKESDLHVSVLGKKNISDVATERFNEIAISSNWLAERSRQDGLDLIPYQYPYIKVLAEKYNTNNFMWMGLVNARLKGNFNPAYLALSILSIYGLPFYLISVITPDYSTYYYAFAVDIESGEILINNSISSSTKDNGDLIKSQVYDTFFQLKREKNYTK